MQAGIPYNSEKAGRCVALTAILRASLPARAEIGTRSWAILRLRSQPRTTCPRDPPINAGGYDVKHNPRPQGGWGLTRISRSYPSAATRRNSPTKRSDWPRERCSQAARRLLGRARQLGERQGYRNAQTHRHRPHRPIGGEDCDTTGGEPDFALVKVKKRRRRVLQNRQPTLRHSLEHPATYPSRSTTILRL